ncbi:MAG: transaldolase [Anaerolineales bacterium]
MNENPLVRLNRMGQSVWYDNIRRGLLESGELLSMVRAGELRGVTSNPTIFEDAIAHTEEYHSALQILSQKRFTAEQAYEQLALDDIRAAADVFLPVYEESRGADGYISLEVSPALALDSEATWKEAGRLKRAVDRPNLMIKIPGTLSCLDAIRRTIADGICVNVTLLFSVHRYRKVMEAYAAGLEDRVSRRLPLDTVSSVASFFVSRLDTLIDRKLDQMTGNDTLSSSELQSLRGKAAITNTRLAYQEFLAFRGSQRWLDLSALGARLQRPLWASTSTKDPSFPDTYYVEALIAPDSVNTMPPATIAAYRDHGNPAIRIGNDLEEARALPGQLAQIGISLEQATNQLETDGIEAFQRSFQSMLAVVENRLSKER